MSDLKLKPEIKARFIKALRSNEYMKAEGCLKDQDCFCALGVLADLAVQDKLARWYKDSLVTSNGYMFASHFPSQLITWACGADASSLDTNFPLPNSKEAESLSHANDELGMSLPEIACLVEKYL